MILVANCSGNFLGRVAYPSCGERSGPYSEPSGSTFLRRPTVSDRAFLLPTQQERRPVVHGKFFMQFSLYSTVQFMRLDNK